ncbi:GNAT family N-acetyltransferase [Streptomyces exfoliatus]|uniref:GNAT family N-acetyltransferase n=1 Tax=Streptomyces exfoliatus TaxID=1905 RepID=UPI0037B5C6F8
MHLLQDAVEQQDPESLSLYLSEPSPANRFGVGLVAEVDGEVVGVVAGAGIRLPLSGLAVSGEEIARRIGLLDVLAVDPGHRRQGIGALLCDSLATLLQDGGHRLMVTKLAAGRHDLVPLYTSWGWKVGNPGEGVAVEIGPHHVVIAEDPSARTAWAALTPQVRPVPSRLPGVSILTGMFS